MRILVTLLVSSFVASSVASAQEKKSDDVPQTPPPKISTEEATKHYQETMTVTGKVAQVSIREKLVYINLDKKFPDSPFTCVIFSRATNQFGNIKALEGKSIEVTGKIDDFHDKPQIVLNSTNQLKVVEHSPAPAAAGKP